LGDEGEVMPKPDTIYDPKHWRDRAAEMRALADCMEKPETMAVMAKLAEDYDKLADRAEARESRKPVKGKAPSHE
jgi:hypothetical protein